VILVDFLKEIKRGKVTEIDFGALVDILLPHCTAADDLTRLIAVTWLNELIVLGKEKMLPYSSKVLAAILPGFSNDVLAVQEQTVKVRGEHVDEKGIADGADLFFMLYIYIDVLR
tara:strand:+ start:245 stop:589 length:345 start_codon:yes stop_codon:yes gene_type:complete